MATTQYDMVIYGATGYTAGLAIDYLLKHKTGANYSWAIAGRNKGKLEALLAEKAKTFGATANGVEIAKIPIIVASTDDAASLDAMCKQAKVLLAMAGPYAICGLPVVGACVRNGTHYVDITGEFQFIRQAIEQYHEQAKAKKVAIVNTCGFDCVPSDMGSLMMHEHVAKESNVKDTVTEIIGYFGMKASGIASGGTAHSAANMFKTIKAADHSPVSLNPPNMKTGIVAPKQSFIGYSPFVKRWTVPFIMAGGNERTVRRSNALLGRPTSIYWEAATSPSMVSAVMSFGVYVMMGVFLGIAPLRAITTKYILPKQGEGPTPEQKKNSAYTAVFHAKTKSGKEYKGTWKDRRNAYDSTGTFIVEAAATILEQLKAQGPSSIYGGVVPPAAALGVPYFDRLMKNDCGVTTSIEEVTKSK